MDISDFESLDQYVLSHTSLTTLLRLLSEECSELSQASLKYDRFLSPDGYCDESITERSLISDITTEIADVFNMIRIVSYLLKIDQSDIKIEQLYKMRRWNDRIYKKLCGKSDVSDDGV